MTPGELAELLDVSVASLAQWRYLNTGPPYFKIGRRVRYLRSAVENWVAELSRA